MNHETPSPSHADIHEEKHPGQHQKPGEIPDHLKPYLPKAQKFIDSHREVFYAIAQDRSLTFKPGTGGFYTDLKTGEVNFDIADWKQQQDQGLSTWQTVWKGCHELGHFNDLREDPQAMLGNFTYMEEKARQLEPRVRGIWESRFGELPEGLAVDRFLYGRIAEFYNILDDLYINKTIARRAAPFGPTGSQKDEAKRLYRDFLFPTDPDADTQGTPPQEGEPADYSSRPKSQQFAYVLLRRAMVPDQELLVSPEVTEKLEGYSDEIARKYGTTLEDEVKMITDPANQQARNPGWRYERIQKNVEDAFLDLLMQDMQEQPMPEVQKGEGKGKGEGEGDGQSEDSQEEQEGDQEEQAGEGDQQKNTDQEGQEGKSKPKNPWDTLNEHSHFDKEAVEDFLNEQKEKEQEDKKQKAEEAKKARLTPEEREQEAQKQTLRKIAEEHGINPRFAEEYRKLEESVRPYKEETAQVFEQLMNTISQQIQTYWMEGFRSGKFNTDNFVRKYGPLLAAEQPDLIPWEVLDTYDQQEFERRLSLFPDEVDVDFVLDGSNSMDQQKLLALKQLLVLSFEGLSTFEETMKLRFKLKDPVKINTRVIMFGSAGNSKIIKDFGDRNASYRQEYADRFDALSKITNNYGDTCDAEPMWYIADDIDPQKSEKLKAGKAKKFIFEVTDGGSNQPSARAGKNEDGSDTSPAQDTRNAIEAAKQKGAITRAFQVGEVSDEEKETFTEVWGNEGEQIAHPKDLPPALARLLADEILKTSFMVDYAPDSI